MKERREQNRLAQKKRRENMSTQKKRREKEKMRAYYWRKKELTKIATPQKQQCTEQSADSENQHTPQPTKSSRQETPGARRTANCRLRKVFGAGLITKLKGFVKSVSKKHDKQLKDVGVHYVSPRKKDRPEQGEDVKKIRSKCFKC
ncbi:hypothetical protein ElyMa_002276500 [Elysia marginata]|uniref:BZIP domain-containing protein n=1 Tax=Elysia marginata TaxID=1093978 RepID=A0AAV4G1B5_9GAST|nr:hypothetical protein ElyMa_002276500 [Elysia marginata]